MPAEDRSIRGNEIRPEEVYAAVVDASELYQNGEEVGGAPDYVEGHVTQGAAGTAPVAQSDGSLAMESIPDYVEDHTTQGAAGTVPTAQSDGTLMMEEAGGSGLWNLDTSESATGVNSHTINLSSSWDSVMVAWQISEQAGNNIRIGMQINGDTNANYYIMHSDGTRTTAANYVQQVDGMAANGNTSSFAVMDGRWAGTWRAGKQAADSGSKRAIGFNNGSATSPLTSVRILTHGGSAMNIEMEVYGRDIINAGAP